MNLILVIVGIVLFNLIVLAHEFGHFFWAKKFGVQVNEFALGMGPQIFKLQKGETVFSLRLFPIGGFCAMEGEDDGKTGPKCFESKPAWQRAIIIVFGATMNLVIGFILTVILFIPSTCFPSTTIDKFSSSAVSCNHGLRSGDKIRKIDGNRIINYKDLSISLLADGKSSFDIEVERDGKIVNLEDVVFDTGVNSKNRIYTKIDFTVCTMENNFVNLMSQSFLDTISNVKFVWTSVIGMITQRFSFKDASGPIGIVSVMSEAGSEGLKRSIWVAIGNIVGIIAMITINLGVVNLLPLPALDGGRLLFIIFEIITGRKVDSKYEGWIHGFGFALFMILMIVVAFNDIMRIFGKT